MTDADRKRLVALLGMLGSAHAGERDNAARLAEQFRKRHGLTWEEMLAERTIYVDREIIIERPAPPPPQPPPPPSPPETPASSPSAEPSAPVISEPWRTRWGMEDPVIFYPWAAIMTAFAILMIWSAGG